MSHQAKAGDVGAGICAHLHHHILAVLVEGRHRFHHLVIGVLVQQLRFVRSGQHTDAQRFGQHQQVAFLAVAVLHYMVGMDKAGDAQSILRLGILDGVSAGNDGSGFLDLVRAALHDFCHNVHRQAGRKANQIHRQRRVAAHRINIAQGVGCRNLTKGVRVVHDGREKVHRLHNRQIISNLIDQSVVAGVKAYNQLFIGKFR